MARSSGLQVQLSAHNFDKKDSPAAKNTLKYFHVYKLAQKQKHPKALDFRTKLEIQNKIENST